MKKILGTTLALSLAVVSGLDARQQARRRGRSQSLPVQQIAQKTQDMKDAQKAGDIQAAVKMANQVQSAVAVDPNTAALWNAVKDVEAKKREIEGLKAELKELKVSWFGSWTNTDYKSKAAEIKTARNELKGLEAKEAELRAKVGEDTAGAIKIAALGTAALAIAAGITDWYFDLGYGKAAYKYASTSRFGGYAGQAKEAVVGTWKKYGPEILTGTAAAEAAADAAAADAAAAQAAADAAAAQAAAAQKAADIATTSE